MDKTRGYGGVVLGLFFTSGATALVYEVVWSKYLALMFGSTIQAQTVVLAVFMGGLALGNKIFGARSDALTRPLHVYGIIEIFIGIYAYGFPWLHQAADNAFVALGTRWFEHSTVILLLKAFLSVGLLLLPTILMGGTLPLLAGWLQRHCEDASRRSARFYSVNSLGAVTGAGLAGFYLVQTLGLVATLQTAAALNVSVGLLAVLLERRNPTVSRPKPEASTTPSTGPASPASASTSSPEAAGASGNLRWACVLVAVSGGVSMGLEVLSSRSLSLIFGSNLQSFAMVLVSFILGIGLGSAAIASAKGAHWRSERAVVWLLMGAALWVGLLVFRIEWWVEFYRVAKSGLARSSVGYVYYLGLAALLSTIVLGIPAALIGSVLPLLIRLVGGESLSLGRMVGRLLTWNTLGAVGGTVLTGFVLMPHVGLRGSFGVLACGLCAMALLLAWKRNQTRLAAVSGGILVLIAVMFVGGGEGWRHVMSSGAFRAKETEVLFNVMEQRKTHIKILFYEDAPDATVSVEQGDGIGAPDDIGLRINGKTDASSRIDLSTQMLIGHLPLMARPDAKDVFILGLGSGVTGGAVLGHPIQQMVTAENCEPVVRGAKFFEPWNGGVLTDRRSRIVLEDARTVLKLSPQMYDVIITQPSNPWMAGVGSVFSREYYQLGASRLKEGGLMAQWFHVYDMHDGIVEMVMRTFGSVFPYLEVWDCGLGDIALLGSLKPWAATPEDYERGFERPLVRTNLANVGIHSVKALFARQLASQKTGFAIAREGVVQSDLFPVLEYEAPRAFFLGIASTMLSRYDERTWQLDLASPAKVNAVTSLSDENVRPVFANYGSMNDDLLSLLTWKYGRRGDVNGAPSERIASMPCLFSSTNRVVQTRLPPDATVEEQQFLSAATLLRNRTRAHDAALQQMETVLQAKSKDATWPHWNQVSVAAKAALSRGDVPRARQWLDLALRYAPNDRELQYVSRIVNREQK